MTTIDDEYRDLEKNLTDAWDELCIADAAAHDSGAEKEQAEAGGDIEKINLAKNKCADNDEKFKKAWEAYRIQSDLSRKFLEKLMEITK